jgi:hypothetical protein
MSKTPIRRLSLRLPELMAADIEREAAEAYPTTNAYILELLRSHPSRKPSNGRKDGGGGKVKGGAG